MKAKTLLLSLLLPFLQIKAQVVVPSDYLKKIGDYSYVYRGEMEPWFNYSLWTTHPYWSDNKFHEGLFCYDGRLYSNVLLRYDIFNNTLAIATPMRRLAVIPDQSRIEYFTMDGRYFVPMDGRFVCVNYAGSQLSLVCSRIKKKGTEVTTGQYARRNLNESTSYYILADGKTSPVSSRFSLQKLFPQYRKEIKIYCKEEGLEFDSKDLDHSLTQCALYIDSMLCMSKGVLLSHKSKFLDLWNGRQRNSEEQSQVAAYVDRKVLDSICSQYGRVTDMPAYISYRYDSDSIIEPDDVDDVIATQVPGVEKLDPFREVRTLEEVQVVGMMHKFDQVQGGLESIRPALLKNIPIVMGESDVMKMALTLPGIKSMGEASNGINVRGGSTDQNLILYNKGTVYNPMHMFGLFSAFNSDMIAESKIFKGGIPARYGGRISSVMDISNRYAGDEWHAQASVGILSSKALVEAPIVRDKVYLLLSGRTTYSDWMLKRISGKTGYQDGKAGFWDLGGSLAYVIDAKNRINIHGYHSHDSFSFTATDNYSYNNTNLSVEWKSRLAENVSASLNAGYDHYDYRNDDETHPYEGARLRFSVNDFFVKGEAVIESVDKHKMSVGFDDKQYNLMPGKYTPLGELSEIAPTILNRESANEFGIYAEDEFTFNDKLSLIGGLRMNSYLTNKESSSKVYLSPEIRLSGSWKMSDVFSWKAGYNNMHQYIHKVSNTAIMSPTDVWTLSSSRIKPQSGYQISTGWYLTTKNRQYEISAELYYKRMNNYLTYRGGSILVMNPNLADDVISAQGKSYGAEFQIHKMYGKLDGWLSYTYSRTYLRQNDPGASRLVNDGNWYSAEYDSPHEFKFVSNYKLTRRYSISLNGTYMTGRPVTLPSGQYYSNMDNKYHVYYLERNGSRMPDYLRFDASVNIEAGHHLTNRLKCWWSFGVYNLLGRHNAYSVYYQSVDGNLRCYKLSIFGAQIPFLSFNFKL